MATSNDDDYILLGFTEKEPVVPALDTFKENLIGGKPYFSPLLSASEFEASISLDHLTCKSCKEVMSFIAQIYCPVDDSQDRVLYSFLCTRKGCPKRTWSVCRVLTPFMDIAKKPDDSKKKKDFDEDDWDDDEENAVKEQEVPSDKVEAISLDNEAAASATKSFPLPPEVTAFTGYFLVVEEEDYLLQDETDKNKKPPNGVVVDEPASAPNEGYEKFLIPGTDEVSHKFLRRINKFPGQVVRYNLNGKPLLNHRQDIEPEKCSSCGVNRRFELQFTPGLITSLEPLDKKNAVYIDFGTALIFTCKDDCRVDGKSIHWEQALVQDDPDSEAISRLGT